MASAAEAAFGYRRCVFANDVDFANFLRVAAITSADWLDVREQLGIGLGPYARFVLFRACELPRALALLSLDYPATITERVSVDPVRDGYVALLEMTCTENEPPMRAGVDAFIARERERAMEPYLRSVYGNYRPAAGEVLHQIDYPVFDNGSCDVGFGLATDHRTFGRSWLWSRVSFAHK